MIPWKLVNSRKLFGWRLPTDGEGKFVRDFCNYLPMYTASKSRRRLQHWCEDPKYTDPLFIRRSCCHCYECLAVEFIVKKSYDLFKSSDIICLLYITKPKKCCISDTCELCLNWNSLVPEHKSTVIWLFETNISVGDICLFTYLLFVFLLICEFPLE
jgi:hypothetical protein